MSAAPRKAGGWVAKSADLAPGWRWNWPRLKDGQRPFTDAEQARYDELQAYLDADDDDATDEAIAAAHAEVAAIKAAARIPLGAEDRARSGVVVTLGHDGKIAVEQYVVRPEDVSAKPEPVAPAAPAEPDGTSLPNALVERLCDTATAAVQATLGSSPTAGLVALLAGALTADAYAAPMKLRLEGVGGAQAALRDKEPLHALVARLAGRLLRHRRLEGEAMTPRDMVALMGRALTGTDDWAKPLPRALGAYHPDGPRETIDPRSVSRWCTGAMEVLPWAVEALPQTLREHAARLDEEIARLEERADEMTDAADEIEAELRPPGPRR